MEVRAASRAARSQTGRSVVGQLAEIVGLRRAGLGAGDYYRYRLFDNTRFTRAQKREYTGDRFQDAVYRFVNDPGLMARSDLPGGWGGSVDKLLFDCLMHRVGVPTPRILAVFDTAGIAYGEIETCRTRDDLERVIRLHSGGFFSKPARAHTGIGALAVERVDADTVVLADGRCLPVAAFLDQACEHERVLLQERLSPHPVLRTAAGPALATVRVVVLRRPSHSTIHRTVLRIPTGTNMIDNFDAGHTGNLVGCVDKLTGKVVDFYGGTGLTQVRVVQHPDTGEELEGLSLPDWADACALVDQASRLLSAMPLQAWDLALTDRGPMMIEVNDVSAQDVLQLAGPPGMLDAELCSFLREQGFGWSYPHRDRAPKTAGARPRLPKPASVSHLGGSSLGLGSGGSSRESSLR
jgi:hypothetical protein